MNLTIKMLNRRDFITLLGSGSLAFLSSGLAADSWRSSARASDLAYSDNELDLIVRIQSVPSQVHVFNGPKTNVWSYRGEVLQGNPASLISMDNDSYLGPILRLIQGHRVRIIFQNVLPVESIIHWHGLQVPAEMDGHPRLTIPSGDEFVYEFQVQDRAGTYWYHPHPHGRTGHQVYAGMAGLLLVSDDDEKKLNLPMGAYEVPLVIQDRMFNRDNQLVYLPDGMMSQVNGMLGDTILINGRPDYTLNVATRVYRLRLLNGSNARAYNLAWSDGTPLTILGTDGGLLAKPWITRSVMLGPGERLDVWADFSNHEVGDHLRLLSQSFDDESSQMMPGRRGHGMMGGSSAPPNGATLNLMTVRIVEKAVESRTLPTWLSKDSGLSPNDALNRGNPRKFELGMFQMHGLINGRTFQMTTVADDEVVTAGSSEIWDFVNVRSSMGMMKMSMAHPMHLHGAQFRVIARSATTNLNYMDKGWKDTVLLMPEERIQLHIRFGKHAGMFLYHCHNLEHGDAGMMRNYLIRNNGVPKRTSMLT